MDARTKNLLAMIKSGTAGMVYEQQKSIYSKECRGCHAQVVMRKTRYGKWACFNAGSNEFHRCPAYDARKVTRYP